MTKDQLRKVWEDRIIHYQESGQTMKQWCEENGFKNYQLQYWLKKYRSQNTNNDSMKWVSVSLDSVSETSLSNREFIDISIGKFNLSVQSGYDKTVLKEVLSVLNELC